MIGRLLRRIISSIALLSIAFGIAAISARAANKAERFDGPWSVVIITDQGNCDRAYRYGLRIAAGNVSYAGGSDVTVTGHVDANGRVAVEVRSGGSSARGSGRLSGTTGEGTWQGASQDSRCSGRWEAQRSG
jgi:hypothetical protein